MKTRLYDLPRSMAGTRASYGGHTGTLATVADDDHWGPGWHWVLRIPNPGGPNHPAGPYNLLNLKYAPEVELLLPNG